MFARKVLSILMGALCSVTAVAAQGFICAGFDPEQSPPLPGLSNSPGGAAVAKPAGRAVVGTRSALVVFAQFADEAGWQEVPSWAEGIFDPERPGSFSHFYRTMSLDRLRIRGEVAPEVYPSHGAASTYLADDKAWSGKFRFFSREVLQQVDEDVDFSRFDNDGPDGIPDSGDDDGVVDAVFLNLHSTPRNFLVGSATGIASLGFEGEFVTNDVGIHGSPIAISRDQGGVNQARSFAEAVAMIATTTTASGPMNSCAGWPAATGVSTMWMNAG